MKELILRGLGFVVGVVFSMFIYWLSGSEFLRGEGMAATTCMAVFIGLFIASCPFFEKKNGG